MPYLKVNISFSKKKSPFLKLFNKIEKKNFSELPVVKCLKIL